MRAHIPIAISLLILSSACAPTQQWVLLDERWADDEYVAAFFLTLNQADRYALSTPGKPALYRGGWDWMIYEAQRDGSEITIPIPGWDALAGQDAVLESTFVEALNKLQASTGMSRRDLVYAGCRGVLDTLDPTAVLIGLSTVSSGNAGVGVTVRNENGDVMVINTKSDSPAVRAGIRLRDHIVRVNESTLDHLALDQVRDLLRGPVDSSISLWVRRAAVDSLLRFDLVREKANLEPVAFELMDNGLGYWHFSQFDRDAVPQILAAIDKSGTTPDKLRGLVVDLRNNGGGRMEAVVEVCDLFLNGGTALGKAGRDGNIEQDVQCTEEGTLPDFPVVVLVNAGTAAGAECVAAALQDHRRAVVMGSQTGGWGLIHTVFRIHEDMAAKIPTGQLIRPKGGPIADGGVVPDILISATGDEAQRLAIAELAKMLKAGD